MKMVLFVVFVSTLLYGEVKVPKENCKPPLLWVNKTKKCYAGSNDLLLDSFNIGEKEVKKGSSLWKIKQSDSGPGTKGFYNDIQK